MPRRPRHPMSSTVHHVFNRGVDHQAVFRSDADRVDFGRAIATCCERFDLRLSAYCLMDNHFHLVVHSEPEALSRAMHLLGTTFVRHANDRAGRDGPMFRGRFTALPVTTDAYFVNLVRYVHLNPLAIADVEHPAQYRWSSYRAYLGARRPPAFLDTEPVLTLFGGDVERLVGFTEGTASQPGEWRVGSPELAQIVEREIAAAGLIAEADAAPTTRAVLTALLDHPDERVRALAADGVDHPSPGAQRSARSRVRRKMQADPSWRAIVRRVAEAIIGPDAADAAA